MDLQSALNDGCTEDEPTAPEFCRMSDDSRQRVIDAVIEAAARRKDEAAARLLTAAKQLQWDARPR